jgi:hypothetical protein
VQFSPPFSRACVSCSFFPPSDVVWDKGLRVGSGKWRGGLHSRWGDGAHCVRVSGRWGSVVGQRVVGGWNSGIGIP